MVYEGNKSFIILIRQIRYKKYQQKNPHKKSNYDVKCNKKKPSLYQSCNFFIKIIPIKF